MFEPMMAELLTELDEFEKNIDAQTVDTPFPETDSYPDSVQLAILDVSAITGHMAPIGREYPRVDSPLTHSVGDRVPRRPSACTNL